MRSGRMLPIVLLSVLGPVMGAETPIIPAPNEVRHLDGEIDPESVNRIRIGDFKGASSVRAALEESCVCLVDEDATRKGTSIHFVEEALPGKSEDAYVLRISSEGISIKGEAQGLFYGGQTLATMIASARDNARKLPCLEIEDSPRFVWRGFMLDESRHFSGVAAVKRLIDQMARYKMNRLHWHLVDSPGWRVEIKKYPKLVEIGACYRETDISGNAVPQFYTQRQIRDIVAYAAERHVVIIPEIDMPGHADAAVKAYPEHGGGGFALGDEKGKWPDFTFSPVKPATREFLGDIITEIAALFPDAGVIHFGGDEANLAWPAWEKNPEVASVMREEKIPDCQHLQNRFSRLMAAKIHEAGFKVGAWDEIVATDLDPKRTLVFWYRTKDRASLESALQKNYPVVLCPEKPMYLDYFQSETHGLGRKGMVNTLEEVYRMPDSLNLGEAAWRNVLGMEACLWTEYLPTQRQRDQMTWPRLLAAAESAWTQAPRKDFQSFTMRVKSETQWLKAHGIHPHEGSTDSDTR